MNIFSFVLALYISLKIPVELIKANKSICFIFASVYIKYVALLEKQNSTVYFR